MNTKLISALVASLIVVAVLVTVSSQQSNGGLYKVTSGSMLPVVPIGSTVFIDEVETDTIKVGDIILIQLDGYDKPVLHRVVELGRSCVTTKGDANSNRDLPTQYGKILGRMRDLR